MSFSIGIVGLPNAGKSTLFKALTKKQVGIADYPFTTINPNIGIVPVPDKRLEKISKIINPQKTTKTIIEFIDIAGLVKGAHKGGGLGNQFLAQIRNCDAIVEVVRNFSISKENFKTENQETQYQLWGKPAPKENAEIISTEFLMKDLETAEKAIEKIGEKAKKDKSFQKSLDILQRIKANLEKGKTISQIELNSEEKEKIKEYQFLTAKPKIYLFNIKEETNKGKIKEEFPKNTSLIFLNLKLEEEMSELSEKEREELGLKSQLDQLIINCYNVLELITFFTITGGKETRAWTLKKGSNVLEAAGQVHSDFQEKFIKAEVIPWQKLIEAGSWAKAKESGEVKTAGKEYIVSDGDIIEFKI